MRKVILSLENIDKSNNRRIVIRKHRYSATILEKRKNKQNSAQSFCRGLISETPIENIPEKIFRILTSENR